ncbi:hypothetical protein Amet_1853 [Alkaliphilus metalliredigens QYMF]|uniref:Uncharacterized protein n=1 Tax=Alkaliphilus metalliredigens (strain QYMF) TaxID=293826 RepID=A6TPA4_ALKMQ|nr:hypothetical protein Amet_1853 [Alkaliphilus metalliredigens QYMF]
MYIAYIATSFINKSKPKIKKLIYEAVVAVKFTNMPPFNIIITIVKIHQFL